MIPTHTLTQQMPSPCLISGLLFTTNNWELSEKLTYIYEMDALVGNTDVLASQALNLHLQCDNCYAHPHAIVSS